MIKKKVIKKKIIKKKVIKKKVIKKKFVRKKTVVKRLQSVRVKDITIPKNYSIEKDGISQSLLGAFQCCRQRFVFMLNRWQKIGGDAVFEFGNIYHEMLDQAFTAGKAPSNKVLHNRMNKYAKIRRKELSVVALETFRDKLDMAEMILQEYFKYYAEDFENLKIIKPEQLFRVRFKGALLRGKKDLRFAYIKNLIKIWLMEHKTKGRVDSEILESILNFDLQNLFYITADDIEYGSDIQNVLYNIIRNPGHKRKSGESLKEYIHRIRLDIHARPEHFFIRYQCPYSPASKARFKRELEYKLNDVKAFLAGDLKLYRNELACKTPFRCTYLDACASGNMVGYVQQKLLFPELEDSVYV